MSVVVTGLGVRAPLGATPDELWAALEAGRCAARSWPDLEAEGLRCTVACRVPDLDAPPAARGQALAVSAARQAVAQAAWERPADLAVFVGTTMGESHGFERAAEGDPLQLSAVSAEAFPEAISRALGAGGSRLAIGAACAAGNHAIGLAAEAIANGWARAAVTGGAEPFSRLALLGFSRLRATARERCRPFDRDRDGMQVGEAAAFLLLEREADARARGAAPLARVCALGLSCDADHPTTPRADGRGMIACIRSALAQSGLEPAGIDAICAHGSGTRASDAAEALALATVFPHRPPVFALKGALGHGLGAATAVEAVVSVIALQRRTLPPTVGFASSDLDLDLVAAPRPLPRLRRILSTGFAFGGLNSALILEAV